MASPYPNNRTCHKEDGGNNGNASYCPSICLLCCNGKTVIIKGFIGNVVKRERAGPHKVERLIHKSLVVVRFIERCVYKIGRAYAKHVVLGNAVLIPFVYVLDNSRDRSKRSLSAGGDIAVYLRRIVGAKERFNGNERVTCIDSLYFRVGVNE